MLKILQICNKAPFPADDGSSIAIYNMAQGLIANDVKLRVLAINTKKHFKPDSGVDPAFRSASAYSSVFRNTDISWFGAFCNMFSSQSYFVTRFYFRAFEKQLIELIEAENFDIVQLEGLFMGVYIDTIRKHSRAKVVLRAHNIEHYIWKRHISNKTNWFTRVYLSLQNSRLKKFELRVFSKLDAVVPISETDALEIKNLGCNLPVFTCISGVSVRDYQARNNQPVKNKTIFYFGSMDWLPNQEAVTWFLQHCWDTIHQQDPEARLIIAGRGMPLHFFHITRPNVSIVENVPDAASFYRQHQIMIVPLLSGSGLRIKIIEGMAYGKAIVSTTVGAEGIKCTHEKNILIADTPDAFAAAVLRLLKNESERQQIEQAAAAFASTEFDNSKVVGALTGFYKTLVHG